MQAFTTHTHGRFLRVVKFEMNLFSKLSSFLYSNIIQICLGPEFYLYLFSIIFVLMLVIHTTGERAPARTYDLLVNIGIDVAESTAKGKLVKIIILSFNFRLTSKSSSPPS